VSNFLTVREEYKSKRMSWARHIIHTGDMKNTYKLLVGNLEGEGSLGQPSLK
jgi:hypothetical protein